MNGKERLIDGNGRYTLHASDNTDYSLLFRNGIICVENELGHCVCEFHADDAPAVHAVEVVRCKDCDKISPSVTPIKDAVWCREFRAYMPCGGFCSYGERREEK